MTIDKQALRISELEELNELLREKIKKLESDLWVKEQLRQVYSEKSFDLECKVRELEARNQKDFVWRGKEISRLNDEVDELKEKLEAAEMQIVNLKQNCENDPRIHEIVDLKESVAELATENARIAEQREYYEGVIADGSKRIAELEKGHQEAAKQINSWRRLAKQNIAERGKDISELEAARQRIAELERSETQLISERDDAESALNDAYKAVMGQAPEWSNWFIFENAIDEIELACELWRNQTDDVIQFRQRIAELEAKLETADKLQDSAFRDGLKAGFSYGQTDDQSGFAQCMSAYNPRDGIGVKQQQYSVDSEGSRNQPGMVVAVHIGAGDFVKVKGRVFEVEETDFDDHDVTLWFVGGNALKCSAGCPVEVVSAPVAAGIKG